MSTGDPTRFSFDRYSSKSVAANVCHMSCRFAGFGFPCVILTVLWPFHVGAALCNLLFPIFVLVACESDPVKLHGEY